MTQNEGTCSPLSNIGWLVQFGIGFAAFVVLSFKWYCEFPRRPAIVFSIDVAKQIVGGTITHFVKVFFSKVLSIETETVDMCDDSSCLWYLAQSVLQPLLIVPIAALLLAVMKRFAKRRRAKGQWGHHLVPWGLYGKRRASDSTSSTLVQDLNSIRLLGDDGDDDARSRKDAERVRSELEQLTTPDNNASVERQGIATRFSKIDENDDRGIEDFDQRVVTFEACIRTLSWNRFTAQICAWGTITLLAATFVGCAFFVPLHRQIIDFFRKIASPLRCHAALGGKLELVMLIFVFPLLVDVVNYITIDQIIKRRLHRRSRWNEGRG